MIQAIVRLPNGHVSSAVVLSMTGDAIRLAIPGYNDVIELRSVFGVWVSDCGQPIEIEGLMGQLQGAAESSAKTLTSGSAG